MLGEILDAHNSLGPHLDPTEARQTIRAPVAPIGRPTLRVSRGTPLARAMPQSFAIDRLPLHGSSARAARRVRNRFPNRRAET